jgi:hypothetical protein
VPWSDISAFLTLAFLCLCANKSGAQVQVTPPPTPMTHLDAAQGGKIVYGTVDGATTQAAAMSSVLREVHSNCGEKPQIGKVFQFKGTNTIGVFFTVTNHPGGDKKMAGLVLSAASGPRQVDAAMISNDALLFGKTANPMMRQLFGVWRPGKQPAASGTKKTANTPSAGTAPAAGMHTVVAPDNSASMSVAGGWQLNPHSGGSTMILNGPNGELAVWGAVGNVVDPYNPQQVQAVRAGIYRGTRTILYSYPEDLEEAYPELWQAWRRAINLPPARLQVDSIQPLQMDPQKGRGVFVIGHIDQDGQGTKKLFDIFCISPQTQWGAYTLHSTFNIMTDAQFKQEQNTVMAMMQSVKVDQQVMSRQLQQMLAQKQASDQAIMQNAQRQIQNIRNIGAQATARYNATQAANAAQQANWEAGQHANEAQQANWEAGQDAQARNNQNFSNYLLDQTVVQDNNMYNNGTVGHGTVWNSTADALVKTDPDRFEYVDKPNFWEGTDFHR